MGLRYTLNDKTPETTEIRLVGTQKRIVVDHPLERVSAMWYKWQMSGEYVQDAFKDLSPEQREFLMTGITPKEWNDTFWNRVPNPEFCRDKETCQETGKCEAIRKYNRSCND
jgi:hypothetical protein